ncbi:L,D-transpeptidase family protein [uncultured Draconibacterium sp.]|uniref:L,D-transpeptidase family protein n=1 Tax=uncultured Draconibacterium sp. TaxID=1573823 RepID=UPI0029C628D4|nr:L,D-transpeptidase family protein [uncultured Draconibacterium sp.]
MILKYNKWAILFVFLFAMAACKTAPEKPEIVGQKILESIQWQSRPDVRQVLVVFNSAPDDHNANLLVYEKTKQGWQAVFEMMPAGIGENGFAPINEKIEGDGKSPTGIFALGQLFTYLDRADTKMPYQKTTAEDKWIDDPESENYNRYVHGETDAQSYENLLLKSDAYKYCMVIEYNTNPVVKGKGSAIFFHLNKTGSEPTAGCVAITERNMLRVLKWLDPKSNPLIIMGNKDELLSGISR